MQEIGGRWGIVFDRVTHASFAEQMLRNSGESAQYLETMVRLHMRIHAYSAIRLYDLKIRLADNIAATILLDERRKRDLLDRIANMARRRSPVPRRLSPDEHPGEASRPVIIDWPDGGRGDPAADLSFLSVNEITCS